MPCLSSGYVGHPRPLRLRLHRRHPRGRRRCCRFRCFAARCFVRRIVGELVKSRKGELARAIVTSIALVNAPLTRTSGQTRKIYRLRAGKTTTTRCTTVAGEFSRDFKSSWNYVFSANVGRGIARISSLSLSLPFFFLPVLSASRFSFSNRRGKEKKKKKRSEIVGLVKLKIRSKDSLDVFDYSRP